MRQFAAILALPFVLGLVVGCNSQPLGAPTTVPVSGKIYLPGGQPMSAGRLTFVPKDPSKPEAYCEVEKDGSFQLTSFGKDAGAPPGEYVVTAEAKSYKSGSAKPVSVSIPKKYTDSKTSDLLVTVTDGMGPLTLRMK